MGRAKWVGTAAFLAPVFLFSACNLMPVVTSGEIYARHMGWVRYADHPASFSFSLLVQLLFLAAAPTGLFMAWRFRRKSERNLREGDRNS